MVTTDQDRHLVGVAKEFGAHLIGRDIGLGIRKKHFGGSPDTWPAGLDMSGVEQATESCMDEMLGALARAHGVERIKSVAIVGAAKAVAETIEYVLSIASAPPVCLTAQTIQEILRPHPVSRTRKRKPPPRRRRSTHAA